MKLTTVAKLGALMAILSAVGTIYFACTRDWAYFACHGALSVLWLTISLLSTEALARGSVIKKLTEYCEEIMENMRKDHKNGKKVIDWYKSENERLQKELDATKEQLKRLTTQHHIIINENEEDFYNDED